MKKTNCPEVKNNKRKVALANLELRLATISPLHFVNPNVITEKAIKRIKKEIEILKGRIV